jgi:hypothetical protein
MYLLQNLFLQKGLRRTVGCIARIVLIFAPMARSALVYLFIESARLSLLDNWPNFARHEVSMVPQLQFARF